MIFQCANQLDYQTWGTHRSEDRNLASIKHTFIEVAQWKRGGPIPYLLPFAGGDDNSRRAETLLASGPDDATLGFCIGDSRPLGPPPTDEAIPFFYWLDS